MWPALHAALFLLSVLAVWLVLRRAVRLAVFPYTTRLITHGHHREFNHRLAIEITRLIKGVSKIINSHMLYEEDYFRSVPDLISMENNDIKLANMSNSDSPEKRRLYKIAELKCGSIEYFYKEFCQMITKLIETCELFLKVNQDLI